MSEEKMKVQLEALVGLVNEEKNKLQTSFKVSLVVYGILVLFVFGYTFFVMSKIRELATPKILATQVADMVETKVPKMTKLIQKNSDKYAEKTADQIVQNTHKIIPKVEDIAKKQIDNLADKVVKELNEKFLPVLKKHITDNTDKILKQSDVVTDKELAKALAIILKKHLENETDKILHNNVSDSIASLKERVESVCSTPTSSLTKKNAAIKKVIINWMFLVEKGDIGNSKFVESIKFLNVILENLNLEDIGDPKVEGVIHKM